jgi:hypothetical protein
VVLLGDNQDGTLKVTVPITVFEAMKAYGWAMTDTGNLIRIGKVMY